MQDVKWEAGVFQALNFCRRPREVECLGCEFAVELQSTLHYRFVGCRNFGLILVPPTMMVSQLVVSTL